VRIEVTEALKDIGDHGSIESLIKILIAPLRLGNDADKIEAITRIQGRAPSMFLTGTLSLDVPLEIIKALENVQSQKKLDLSLVKSALLETATDPSGNRIVGWYALTALAD